nr:MAG TPA: hypothetical protein [Caudoviricetes sp.]
MNSICNAFGNCLPVNIYRVRYFFCSCRYNLFSNGFKFFQNLFE